MPKAEERKLAAIMFADIVGYSRMMSLDEDRTLELLKDFEDICTPIVASLHGKILKKIGDEIFCEFSSSKNAVDAGLEIQKSMSEYNDSLPKDFQLNVRIGIHIGDVVKRDNDIHGDGVNIASRIQPFSKPGGICITSSVQDALRGHPKYNITKKGDHELKNILHKYSIFQVETGYEKLEDQEQKTYTSKIKYSKKTMLFVGMVLSVIMLSLFLYNNNSSPPKKETYEIFITNVQSNVEEIVKISEFLKRVISEELFDSDASKVSHVSFSAIDNQQLLDKMYNDIITSATSEFYQKYGLISNEEMQNKLAKEGNIISFDKTISIVSTVGDGMEGVEKNLKHIMNFVKGQFYNNDINGYMIITHAYNINPPVDGYDIVGAIDMFYGSDSGSGFGYIAKSKNFGDDVIEKVSKKIDSNILSEFSSTVISVNDNKVLIRINDSAKPKKFSTMACWREYDLSDFDKWYKVRINEFNNMFAYCDTVQNSILKANCESYINDEYNLYLHSKYEYEDLLKGKHKLIVNTNQLHSIDLDKIIIIEEVFDTTAIGIIKEDGMTWNKLKKGDKLTIK